MSLPLHLQSIKSSGVYRFVFDKSVMNDQLTAETLRLLVGYSDKGPFNTPVYITSRDEFIRTYGNISKRLEKKGIYFHRLALQALAAGPILCLNLKNFTDSNKLQYAVFNASGTNGIYSLGPNVGEQAQKVTKVYDTNRFWTVKAILIATTNLTINLDKAFERRFLYKLKFNIPSVDVKCKIWKAMMPELADVDAHFLAEKFDFSGGQIENVVRKRMIQSILEGQEPDIRAILTFCCEEQMGSMRQQRQIGF